MTTVGNAIMVFKILCKKDLPGNFLAAINKPVGMQIIAASMIAISDIFSDVQTIMYSSASKLKINLIAADKA